MIRPKTLGLHQLRTLLNLPRHPSPIYPQNPSLHTKSLIPNSISRRNISLSSQFQHEFATQEANKKPSEPLFTDPIRLSQTDIEDGEYDKEKLKKNLRKLESELRRCQKDLVNETEALDTFFTEAVGLSEMGQNQEPEKRSEKLSNLFFPSADQRDKSREKQNKEEELIEYKELPPDMITFAKFLHSKGYLIKANFLPNNNFDASCFENNYGREFLKFAAEEFAKDHREIYKWLPTGDLKKVAQFGCPSVGRKTVFSAKAMRLSFGIREETVCNLCAVKESCKFANQSVWKKGAKNLDLTVVMRVVTLYALPTRFEVPDEVRNAVNRLLKEVIRLTEIA